ncbi:MAG: CHAD domain-containing protein [Deefgea sp.]
MPKNTAYLLLIAQQLSQLQRTGHAIIEGMDSEALHDFRVALRSLRTLLPLELNPRNRLDLAIMQAWKALAKLSNTSRDAEVMIVMLGSQISAEQSQLLTQSYNTGIEHLKTILVTEQLKTLASGTLNQSHHRLSKLSAQQLKQRIQETQTALRHSLLAAHNNITPTLNDWHARRIIVKQLRYLTHLTADWSPVAHIDVLPALKTAQTSLGNLQDQYVLTQWLGNTKINKSRQHAAERDWIRLILELK